MADTQEAPQPAVQPLPELPGSVREAQEALLGLMEPEEEKPQKEEAQPTEEEESTEETQDESLEEEPEESEEESEEEDDEGTDEREVEGDDLYAITINGEEHEVSIDELLKGYSRQSDYTKKTQELSEQRKSFDEVEIQYKTEVAQIQAERGHYMRSLQSIIDGSLGKMDEFSNINWEQLRQEDPIEFVAKKEEFRDKQEKINTLRQEQQGAQQRQSLEKQRFHAESLEREHAALTEKLPEWGKEESRKKLTKDLRDYALSAGFEAEEVSSLVDHRSIIVLLKASKYDKINNADVKAKKLKNKPRVIRAGSGVSKERSTASQRSKKMKRLKESGHVKDASALFEDFVEL
jgi:hypothetical protein